jgi:hypothetical protein
MKAFYSYEVCGSLMEISMMDEYGAGESGPARVRGDGQPIHG